VIIYSAHQIQQSLLDIIVVLYQSISFLITSLNKDLIATTKQRPKGGEEERRREEMEIGPG